MEKAKVILPGENLSARWVYGHGNVGRIPIYFVFQIVMPILVDEWHSSG